MYMPAQSSTFPHRLCGHLIHGSSRDHRLRGLRSFLRRYLPCWPQAVTGRAPRYNVHNSDLATRLDLQSSIAVVLLYARGLSLAMRAAERNLVTTINLTVLVSTDVR